MEKYVEPWVYEMQAAQLADQCGPLTWNERLDYALGEVRTIVGRVWPWVIVGVAVGGLIHGYMPEDFLDKLMGKQAWWSVPAAVALGVPLYSNPAGVFPVLQALLEKGAALGTALAFMMAVIGLSLPEAILLRQVLRPRLIVLFFGIVTVGIMLVGYLFNWAVVGGTAHEGYHLWIGLR
jgi:uncharacterized membrane protein YraQ (UPF0718 family)